jgi:hypothetical protein
MKDVARPQVYAANIGKSKAIAFVRGPVCSISVEKPAVFFGILIKFKPQFCVGNIIAFFYFLTDVFRHHDDKVFTFCDAECRHSLAGLALP